MLPRRPLLAPSLAALLPLPAHAAPPKGTLVSTGGIAIKSKSAA